MRIWIRDPESFRPCIRDPGWKNSILGYGIKHPRSATLVAKVRYVRLIKRIDLVPYSRLIILILLRTGILTVILPGTCTGWTPTWTT
jgi:hypothetical protein